MQCNKNTFYISRSPLDSDCSGEGVSLSGDLKDGLCEITVAGVTSEKHAGTWTCHQRGIPVQYTDTIQVSVVDTTPSTTSSSTTATPSDNGPTTTYTGPTTTSTTGTTTTPSASDNAVTMGRLGPGLLLAGAIVPAVVLFLF